ncbi:type VI secretion system protein ImpA [Roseateles sp. YR242]|uniref:type VI secretion system protein TssA n=1 Tax=Roseateles sp. YR242 TaxID=1855305 RepID=UPI0008B91482|nr:type VI secretion system ImpA family N-terminal domain-containing protein [Roseateles sp. YR242]SEK22281.1 type VI secretion system protein ImpA [Roseateles sp. YR242]
MDALDVTAWLAPLDDSSPCGPDLSFTPGFLALQRSLAGRPESQFAAGEPPSWPEVLQQSAALMAQSRDLRVALAWSRASIRLQGLSALPVALELISEWLHRFWDELHPRPEVDPDAPDATPDPYARLGLLSTMDQPAGLLGDLRDASLWRDRPLAALRIGDIEKALNETPLPADDSAPAPSISLIQGLWNECSPERQDDVRAAVLRALTAIGRIHAALSLHVESVALRQTDALEGAFETPRLMRLLTQLQSALADPLREGTEVSAAAMPPAQGPAAQTTLAAPAAFHIAALNSRADVIRALQAVRRYLEQTEPSHPAQWLLLRAERLMDKTFLELIRELAPEAAESVARTLGLSTDGVLPEPA